MLDKHRVEEILSRVAASLTDDEDSYGAAIRWWQEHGVDRLWGRPVVDVCRSL